MRFSYPAFQYEISANAESITVYRPVIPVVIGGRKRSISLRALLDTGADYTLLPRSVAKSCDIILDSK